MEDFIWDGLALVKRGNEQLMNEPHAGGGAPILSSAGTSYFNDLLGTTLGEKAKGHKYLEASQTAFGEGDAAYFTGKPPVSGLGRVFLFRNYRPELGKWQTADPLGYPDGWNQLAYCGNEIINSVDIKGFWKFVLIGENRYMNNIIGGTCGQDPKSKKDIYTEYAKLSGSVSVSGNYTRQLIYSFTAAVLFKDTELEIDSSLSILYKVFFNINDDGHVSTRVEGDSSITKGKCQLDFPALTPYTQITGSYLSDTKKIRISGLLRIPDFKVEE